MAPFFDHVALMRMLLQYLSFLSELSRVEDVSRTIINLVLRIYCALAWPRTCSHERSLAILILVTTCR